MFTRDPKWVAHPDMSRARGPAIHLGAMQQTAPHPEHDNLAPSAVLAVEVVTCPADSGGYATQNTAAHANIASIACGVYTTGTLCNASKICTM